MAKSNIASSSFPRANNPHLAMSNIVWAFPINGECDDSVMRKVFVDFAGVGSKMLTETKTKTKTDTDWLSRVLGSFAIAGVYDGRGVEDFLAKVWERVCEDEKLIFDEFALIALARFYIFAKVSPVPRASSRAQRKAERSGKGGGGGGSPPLHNQSIFHNSKKASSKASALLN